MGTARDAATGRTTPAPAPSATSGNGPPAPLGGRRVRAAVIGTGAIASGSHLPALARLAEEGEAEVVAAVGVDREAVERFCAEGGVPHACTDLDRMPAEQRPDLVSVCTPPTPHRDRTVAALRAGAWVWCEKPPGAHARRLRRRPGGGGRRRRPVHGDRLPAPLRLGLPARAADARRTAHLAPVRRRAVGGGGAPRRGARRAARGRLLGADLDHRRHQPPRRAAALRQPHHRGARDGRLHGTVLAGPARLPRRPHHRPDGGGPETTGAQAPWLAYTGEHDGADGHATLVFAHAPENDHGGEGGAHPAHWFVRNDQFAAVAPSLAFFDELELVPATPSPAATA